MQVSLAVLILLASLLHTAQGKFSLRASSGNSDGPLWANYGKSREVFFNDGRFYGWDTMHNENKGTVEEVRKKCFDNKVDSDTHCLKFTQTYVPDYRGKYHSEVVLYNATQHGKTEYYGFAFKIDFNWEFRDEYAHGSKVINNRIAIAQFITLFKDAECPSKKKAAVPTTMLWLQNDKLYIRLRTGVMCTERSGQVREFKVGQVSAGQWHTVVFGVHWHKEKEGWFKVWFDKQLRIDEQRIKTVVDIDDRMFQFRVGIYPNWFTPDGRGHPMIPKGGQKFKQLWIDHVGFGPDYSDADPWGENPTVRSLTSKISYYMRFITRMKQDSQSYIVDAEIKLMRALRAQLRNISTTSVPDDMVNPVALKSLLVKAQKENEEDMRLDRPSAQKPTEAEDEAIPDQQTAALPEANTDDTDTQELEKDEGASILKDIINGAEGGEDSKPAVNANADTAAQATEIDTPSESNIADGSTEGQEQGGGQGERQDSSIAGGATTSGDAEEEPAVTANSGSEGTDASEEDGGENTEVNSEEPEILPEDTALAKHAAELPVISSPVLVETKKTGYDALMSERKKLEADMKKKKESAKKSESSIFNTDYLFLGVSLMLVAYVFRGNFRDLND